MATYRRKLKPQFLGLLFIVAVIVPAVILSLLALRTVKSEVAYTEKRLQSTLTAETRHVTDIINVELANIQKEISSSLAFLPNSDYGLTFAQWRRNSVFVTKPFLLSSKGQIIWPSPEQAVSEETRSFLSANKPVFEDKKEVLVYQNIAVAYKDDIIRESFKKPQSPVLSPESIVKQSKSKLSFKRAQSSPSGENYSKQMAVSEFQQYEPYYQSMVYDKARQEGQYVGRRQVMAQTGDFDSEKRLPVQHLGFGSQLESQWIGSPSKFSTIIARAPYGIIPRFMNDTLNLIFWKNLEGGFIAGCSVNEKQLRERILGILPGLYSQARILTVLDENGRPIIEPVKGKSLGYWKKPYVSIELSELLPRWEVAAYLTDPKSIISYSEFTSFVAWILIFILFTSIVAGGTLVLRALHSEMRLAQQKTTFVSNVSHELKTPLTSIRMFAEMLKDKRQPDEAKARKYLEIMVSETERLTRLINNVLDFSRMENGKKAYDLKALDLVTLIKEIIENQKVRLEESGFRVNVIAPAQAVTVYADEEALKQAVINLLSNAEKYSLDAKEIEVEIIEAHNSVLVSIKDRGIGIPVSESRKIFKEFYRVDDSLTAKVKGTGLGLTIARRLIQDHGGEIVYLPRDAGGSIFQMQLPTYRPG